MHLMNGSVHYIQEAGGNVNDFRAKTLRDYSSGEVVLWEIWSRCGENYVGGLAMWKVWCHVGGLVPCGREQEP